jgi:predicted nucleic acid-binding protein
VGLIVDTCVWIDTERKKRDVQDTVQLILEQNGQRELAVSALTLVELADGVSHAREDSTRRLRARFLEDLRFHLPIYPMTAEIAVEAGLLNGQVRARGVTLGLADLLIGVTALHHGHGVLTFNVKHFKAVPNLEVVHLQ